MWQVESWSLCRHSWAPAVHASCSSSGLFVVNGRFLSEVYCRFSGGEHLGAGGVAKPDTPRSAPGPRGRACPVQRAQHRDVSGPVSACLFTRPPQSSGGLDSRSARAQRPQDHCLLCSSLSVQSAGRAGAGVLHLCCPLPCALCPVPSPAEETGMRTHQDTDRWGGSPFQRWTACCLGTDTLPENESHVN